MKTREELEAMGLHPLLAALLDGEHEYSDTIFEQWSLWSEEDGPLFTPGHEPVSKEGRELLRVIAKMPDWDETEDALQHFCIKRSDVAALPNGFVAAVFAYRDSLTPTPKPPEFEGWKRNGKIYSKGNNATVCPDDSHYAWQVDHARDIYCGCRDTLPEAIKAAEDVMRLFGGDQ